MSTTRNTRSKRKVELRQKNTGISIGKIEIEHTDSKKIIFDDDFVASDYESASSASEQGKAFSNEKDESDDEIEQVDNSTAKAHAMEQRAKENKIRIEKSAMANKRKRKVKIVEPAVASDDDLDEEFLSMVDSDLKDVADAKRQQKLFSNNGFVGKHTTFVSDTDNPDALGSITAPIHADHNIDVVVLPDFEDGFTSNHFVALSACLGTTPSATAMSLCRGRIENFESEEKGFETKRSRKMKYSISKGKASSSFRVRY